MISERDKRKLLIPGYGGSLTKEELAYIKASLLASKPLRRIWHMTLRKRGSRITEARIRKIAMDGLPDTSEKH